MKNITLFKKLVDILFFLHVLGLIAVILSIPFEIININEVYIEEWTLLYWFAFFIVLIIYVIFLRGLYFLKKMAGFLMPDNYFSEKIITSLKKSGIHFLLTGILVLIFIVGLWLSKLTKGSLEIRYDSNVIISLFLMIIGIFFIIQSNTISIAKEIKEENELTV